MGSWAGSDNAERSDYWHKDKRARDEISSLG